MKIEVHLQGGLRKIIDITPGATVGATIGTNVFNADGTLYVPPSSGGSSQLSITSWELILNIPPNVTALANTATTGLYAITAAGASATRSIQAAPGETTVSNGDGVAGNPVVGLADVADTGAGALRGITRDAKGRINGTTDATITGTAGQVDVANGDAAAGPPTISLADVADAGGGTFKLLTRDAKGRLSGTSDGDTDDVPEGAGNLYFTDARAQAAVVVPTITNGDTAHAPSGDAVFDALESIPILITGTYSARPAAISVPSGTTYYADDVRETYMSDGSLWSVIGGAGNELGYAEITSTFSTTSATLVDIPGLSVTFTAGHRPLVVTFGGNMRTLSGGAGTVALVVDGVQQSQVVTSQSLYFATNRTVRLPAFTPGTTHTLKLQASVTTGTLSIFASSADKAILLVVND